MWPSRSTRFLGTTWVPILNGISISSAVLTWWYPTDKTYAHKDHRTLGPHLCRPIWPYKTSRMKGLRLSVTLYALVVWACAATRWWLGEEMYGVLSRRSQTKRKTKEDLDRGCGKGLSSTQIDAMDRSRWRKLIKHVWWSRWVWVGECFFWYQLIRVVPHKGLIKKCVYTLWTSKSLWDIRIVLSSVTLHCLYKFKKNITKKQY